MDTKKALSAITDAEWSHLAKVTKKSSKDLQARYAKFVSEHPGHMREIKVKRSEAKTVRDCIRRAFDISVFKIVGVKGYAELCGPRTEWTVQAHICLTLFGDEIWCTDYKLSAQSASVCYNPYAPPVKAQLCFGIRSSNLCFYVSGYACYWYWGWHCKTFDETIVCFG